MTDNERHNAKVRYEKPSAVDLGPTAPIVGASCVEGGGVGQGQCSPLGNSASGICAEVGNSAGDFACAGTGNDDLVIDCFNTGNKFAV